MNAVTKSLLDVVEADPLPPAHTSSHWQRYGQETVVERCGDRVVLQASGFEAVTRMSKRGRLLHGIERLSYRSVTSQLRSYPAVWQAAKRLTGDLSVHPSFTVLKCACALATLVDHWTMHGISPRTFALIGDGFGFLGALIHRWDPNARLYCIDLPKTLVFQARTHEAADRTVRLSRLAAHPTDHDATVVFVLPQEVEAIADDIDCAVSMASMQEMTTSSIARYFAFLRRRSTKHSRFYCVNRLRKELPGGEVISFSDYPWQESDEVFLDGVCPYYTHFFAPYTLPRGPRLCGVRIPFINYFDGVLLHRLTRLASST